MSYCILDKCGNFIAEYKTFQEIEKAYGTPYTSFNNCSSYISAIINNKKPTCKKRLFIKGVTCVNKKDYMEHLDKIIWILTKEDILAINNSGNIIGSYKTIENVSASLKLRGQGISKVLNNINKEYYGYRFVTRECYLNIVAEDPLYFTKEYKKDLGKRKVPVDMYNFKTGEFIKSFDSQTDAAKYMGCSKELIRLSIRNGSPILKTDYYFVLSNKEENSYDKNN